MTRLTAVRSFARTRYCLFGALLLTLFFSGVRFAAAAGPESGRQPIQLMDAPTTPSATTLVTPVKGDGAGIMASCKNFPSDANCNGKDADATGCTADSFTVESLDIYGVYTGSGVPAGLVGKVVLRYSPRCKSMWARTTSYISSTTLTVSSLYRIDGLYTSRPLNGTGTVNSPMLYAQGPSRSVSTQGQVYFSSDGYGVTFGNYYYAQ